MSIQVSEDALKIYQQINQLQQRYSVLNQSLQILYENLEEIRQTTETLTELKTRKQGDTVYIPLGKNALVSVVLNDCSTVLYSICSDIKRNTAIDDAIKHSQSEGERIMNTIKQSEEQKRQLENAIRTLQSGLQRQSMQQPSNIQT